MPAYANLFDAVTEYIGTTSPSAVSEALGTIGKWGATEADYITFLQNAGYTVLEGSNGRYMVYKVGEFFGGNGAGTELSTVFETTAVETTIEGAQVTEMAATGTGAGLLGMEVGAAGYAIAPALGILAGVGLYNLAPEFWTNVSEQLQSAGKLVGGKVQALFDSNGKTSFDEETIEIFKNAFLDAGLFNTETSFPDVSENIRYNRSGTSSELSKDIYNSRIKTSTPYLGTRGDLVAIADNIAITYGGNTYNYNPNTILVGNYTNSSADAFFTFDATELANQLGITGTSFSIAFNITSGDYSVNSGSTPVERWIVNDVCKYIATFTQYIYKSSKPTVYESFKQYLNSDRTGYEAYCAALAWFLYTAGESATQPGATLPDANPFPSTYPDWQPSHTINNNNYYPVSIPTDDITQDPSQTGDNDTDEQEKSIIDSLFDLNPDPDPSPEPEPDPDPQPEPEPEPDPSGDPSQDPINPNPDPIPSGITPVIPPISGVSATRMFTVYNPTDAEINSLGAFLWTSNIIEQIKKMWEDPMGAIISLHKIYATPVTGSMKNIVLGYIDSGVDALQVTDQFTTVDCGSVTISETKRNATDYTPFTTAQIYLPFVGIVEIDLNEIMNGTVHVVYKVDAYTGTCLALVYVQRSIDMPNEQLLYTFSGNASQTLPLTSADFSGAVGALLGLAGAGISVASGGALGIAAGAVTAAHSLTHEMVHVQHSGGLSANSGIMGPRIPYIILSRQHGYDANGYSEMYGYPANKTVYIGNTSGFNRAKSVHYYGNGTEEEKAEIESILKEGFIV